jgi:hypothetical protein
MSTKSVFVFAIGLLAVAPLFATNIIYVSASNDNLYTINPTTGATTLIGDMGVAMSDIAIDPANGQMYGVSFAATSTLYSINDSTAAITAIGTNTGSFLNALTFNATGTVLYAAGGPASGCGAPPAQPSGPTCSTLFTLNTTTGAATAVNGTNNGAYDSGGDLELFGGTMYLTSENSSTSGGTNDTLYSINTTSGAGTSVGSIGFQWVYGLATNGGSTLYGFTDVGNDVISINTTTGAGTDVSTYSGSFEIYGATNFSAVPEPGTLGIMTLGMGLLAGLAVRKRKRT